jgi:hypothetical protein
VKFQEGEKMFSHEFPAPISVSFLRSFLAPSCCYCEREKLILFRNGVRVRDNTEVISGNVEKPFSVVIDRSDNICVHFRYSDPIYYPSVVYDCHLGFPPSATVKHAIERLSSYFRIDAKFLKVCDSAGNLFSSTTSLASVSHLVLHFHAVRDELSLLPVSRDDFHSREDGRNNTVVKHTSASFKTWLTGLSPVRLLHRNCEVNVQQLLLLESLPSNPIVAIKLEKITAVFSDQNVIRVEVNIDQKEPEGLIMSRLEKQLKRNGAEFGFGLKAIKRTGNIDGKLGNDRIWRKWMQTRENGFDERFLGRR